MKAIHHMFIHLYVDQEEVRKHIDRFSHCCQSLFRLLLSSQLLGSFHIKVLTVDRVAVNMLKELEDRKM